MASNGERMNLLHEFPSRRVDQPVLLHSWKISKFVRYDEEVEVGLLPSGMPLALVYDLEEPWLQR